MKKRTIFLLILGVLIILLILLFIGYQLIERSYQRHADQQRMQGLHETAMLIEEYYDITATYPLLSEDSHIQTYVVIGNELQIKGLSTPPFEIVEASYQELEAELERVLGEEITLPFDPQNYGENSRPNMYQYVTDDEHYFLKTYLYFDNSLTDYVAPHYYTFEVTSAPTEDISKPIGLWNFRDLQTNEQYLNLIHE